MPEVIDEIQQELKNQGEAREEFVKTFGYFKLEDFLKWYYEEFTK